MKKWKLAVSMIAVAAFVFTMSGMRPVIAADAPGKVEKAGETDSLAETKMMNKMDKAPKPKTVPKKVDKTEAKEGALAEPFVPGGSSLSSAISETPNTSETPNK